MKNKKLQKGVFISFEGGEGSGKTTLLESLASSLLSMGYDIYSTRAPGATPLGKKIRDLVLHEDKVALSKRAELFLFLADRAQHVEEQIIPALKEHKLVLCDRFNDSTIAYQGAARGCDLSFIEKVCFFAVQGIEPVLTIYLDIDPEIGLKRAAGKVAYDRVESEKIDFHHKVRAAYRDLAERNQDRIYIIDASLPKDIVLALALEKIQEVLCSEL